MSLESSISERCPDNVLVLSGKAYQHPGSQRLPTCRRKMQMSYLCKIEMS